MKKLRVSPFILLLSFKRQPQSSRYQLIRGSSGAKLTNYFTTRLKFTIDRADLRFQGYMVRDIKGPPDRLADTIKAVYTTQLKSKMVTLMTATSFQDWKYLTARDSGGEEFIEGDLLRMTGNLAGRSAKSIVFDSMSDKSFFDLCVRTRGPLNADLIRVDLCDLNLAYGDGKAEKIVVNTGEDFVWRLLDIANRTMLATADLAGVDLDLKWDDEAGKFSVAVSDPRLKDADDLDSGMSSLLFLSHVLHPLQHTYHTYLLSVL